MPEISTDFAFEQLSQMKGGPSVKMLLDLALDTPDDDIAKNFTTALRLHRYQL